MTIVLIVAVLAVVVLLLFRGRRRRGSSGPVRESSPWEALDEGLDPTESA